MDAGMNNGRGETTRHARLKRLAFLWAQAHGYSACAMEVSLPRCRYRADIAAYRPLSKKDESTAIFECKQALGDLRKDNCHSESARKLLDALCQRRQVLENNLRVHYPNLRINDSLFPEFTSHDFTAIGHRGYTRVLRQLSALQNRLYDCTKFDKLTRYRCANLFFLVLPAELFRDSEIPVGWGALVERNGTLTIMRNPVWHETTAEDRIRVLQRIAIAGTRVSNRQLKITFDDVIIKRCRSF
jgi:hypothetical protein